MWGKTLRRRSAAVVIVPAALAAILAATTIFAQPPSGGSSGSYRGPDPGEIVSRMDENGNGQIDPEEMQGRSRFFLESLARDNGLDLTKPIKNDKLRDLMKARFSGGSSSRGDDRSRSSSSSGSGTAAPSSMTTFGGFGVASTGTPATVPGFGTSVVNDSWDVLRQKYHRGIIKDVEEALDRYDRDKDGTIDFNELKNSRMSGDPRSFDRNKDNRLSRSEIAERYAHREAERSRGSSSSSSGGSSGGSGSSSGGSSSSGSSSSSSGSSSGDDRIAKYAEGLLRQYDANKDGVLQKTEWSTMRGEPQKADRDNNGLITQAELAQHLSNYSRSSSGSSSSAGSSSGSSSSGGSSSYGSRTYGSGSSSTSSTAAAGGERKTYRFLTAAERLPPGLPEWFARNDADGDGQIRMSEFATSWNDATAREFAAWDRNGDGIITAAECLKKP